jgi:hypothetical protein
MRPVGRRVPRAVTQLALGTVTTRDGFDVPVNRFDQRPVSLHCVRFEIPFGEPRVRPGECQFEAPSLLAEVLSGGSAIDFVTGPPAK